MICEPVPKSAIEQSAPALFGKATSDRQFTDFRGWLVVVVLGSPFKSTPRASPACSVEQPGPRANLDR